MAVFSFRQYNFEPTGARAVAQESHAFGGQEIALGHEAALDLTRQVFVGNAADLHMVDFLQATVGSSDAGGPCRIGGEQQRPFAGLVKPADWGKSTRMRARET